MQYRVNGVLLETFKAWIENQGAQIRPPTNEWELLRFKFEGGTHVVYANKAGKVSHDQKTGEYASKCKNGAALKKKEVQRGSSNGWARNIVKRGHGIKALLLCATTGPEHVESCGCNALPWEDCEHTKVT